MALSGMVLQRAPLFDSQHLPAPHTCGELRKRKWRTAIEGRAPQWWVKVSHTQVSREGKPRPSLMHPGFERLLFYLVSLKVIDSSERASQSKKRNSLVTQWIILLLKESHSFL